MSASPRSICGRCRRPTVVCYCRHVVPLSTETRVIVLQHPRERDVGINTARIAQLCLPQSEIVTGVDFSSHPILDGAIEQDAWLLYPGAGARHPRDLLPGERPRVLLAVDGTWWQARSILKKNPRLAALPRLCLESAGESRYKIRAEPAPHCMATIEALSTVLGELEGDPRKFESMLRPFDAMVSSQVHFASVVAASRQRKLGPKPPRRFLPGWLVDPTRDRIVVHLEANAWPRGGVGAPPDEIVQWIASRPSTGEVFEAIVESRHGLAPATSAHIQVDADILSLGESFDAFRARWAAFVRQSDVAVAWGAYTLRLAREYGVPLPDLRHDLRPVVRDYLNERSGTLERTIAQLGLAEPTPIGHGRAGRRAAAIQEIVRHLAAANPFSGPPPPPPGIVRAKRRARHRRLF